MSMPAGQYRAGIFKKSMGARHRVGIGLLYRPARLHRLANSFLGIDSGAPYTFKNTSSGQLMNLDRDNQDRNRYEGQSIQPGGRP